MIYLIGSCGFPNYGDELITGKWLRRLARTNPDGEVWVDCHSPGQAQAMFAGMHPNVRFTDLLWRICWAAPSDDPHVVVEHATRAVRDLGVVPKIDIGQPLLHRAEIVHVMGGGYVNSQWPRHLGLLAAAVEMARISGGRAVMTGQGLQPLSKAAAAALAPLVSLMAVVDVRDEPSRRSLAGVVGVSVSASGDDAFLDLGALDYDTRPSPDVMLCAQSDLLASTVDDVADALMRVLGGWGVTSDQVGWVEAIPGEDRLVFDVIEQRMGGIRFYPLLEVWHEGLPARADQRWVSTRFHPHLMAAAAGSWGVAVPVQQGYYDVKHASLLGYGSGWTVLDPSSKREELAVPQPPTGLAGFAPPVRDGLVTTKRRVAQAIYGPDTPTVAGRAAKKALGGA